MSVPSPGDAGQQKRVGWLRLAARTVCFAILWAVLSGNSAWPVGAVFILLATATSIRSPFTTRWSAAGIASFIPYFLWNSLRGAVDVAARALHPGLPVDPVVLTYDMHLSSAAARVLMANTVTLLPGTLSADLEGHVLSVHVLHDSGTALATLEALEQRIADLTGEQQQTEAS